MWEKYAEEVGFVPFAKDTIRQTFDKLEEKEILEIASAIGETTMKELILLRFNKISFDNMIVFLETVFSRYGTVRHDIDGTLHHFQVYHGISIKFSKFLAEIIRATSKDLSYKFRILDIDANILSVEIQELSKRP